MEVSLTEMYFDTRTYEDGITLPAGEYAALRVVIGEGGGHNWWCVMYPPLCLPAAAAGHGGETRQRIESLSSSPGYEARFAVVEWAERLPGAFCGEEGCLRRRAKGKCRGRHDKKRITESHFHWEWKRSALPVEELHKKLSLQVSGEANCCQRISNDKKLSLEQ